MEAAAKAASRMRCYTVLHSTGTQYGTHTVTARCVGVAWNISHLPGAPYKYGSGSAYSKALVQEQYRKAVQVAQARKLLEGHGQCLPANATRQLPTVHYSVRCNGQPMHTGKYPLQSCMPKWPNRSMVSKHKPTRMRRTHGVPNNQAVHALQHAERPLRPPQSFTHSPLTAVPLGTHRLAHPNPLRASYTQ